MMPQNQQQQPQVFYVQQGNVPQQGSIAPYPQQQFGVAQRPTTPAPGAIGAAPMRPPFAHSTPLGFQPYRSGSVPQFLMPNTPNGSLETPRVLLPRPMSTQPQFGNSQQPHTSAFNSPLLSSSVVELPPGTLGPHQRTPVQVVVCQGAMGSHHSTPSGGLVAVGPSVAPPVAHQPFQQQLEYLQVSCVHV